MAPYVETRNGGLYVSGSRVSLDSVVIRFQQGHSPERIVESLPTLQLAQVYGAIAYYLENTAAVDAYLADNDRRIAEMIPPLSEADPVLFARLNTAMREL